jgi:hypothetical protein
MQIVRYSRNMLPAKWRGKELSVIQAKTAVESEKNGSNFY